MIKNTPDLLDRSSITNHYLEFLDNNFGPGTKPTTANKANEQVWSAVQKAWTIFTSIQQAFRAMLSAAASLPFTLKDFITMDPRKGSLETFLDLASDRIQTLGSIWPKK